jgi:predicted ribosome quality control (RQC) complex YloA/Tae2 family protein
MAVRAELRADWLPARFEQVVQRDRTTLCMALRTLQQRGWLTISWHPQAARLHMGDSPPRTPDTFTFSQQLKHQLQGFALVEIAAIAPWERGLDFQFAKRPGDPIQWHLYVEVMGKYSNVILANAHNQIVTAAHQVTENQSSVRPILTGEPYVVPPAIVGHFPTLEETQAEWRARVALLPTALKKALFSAYSGLSSTLIRDLTTAAGLAPHIPVEHLAAADWERLFQQWERWLTCLATGTFFPNWLPDGSYTVLEMPEVALPSVQALLEEYYSEHLQVQEFERLSHQLTQRLQAHLKKLRHKEMTFRDRWQQSEEADSYRLLADLLMAYSAQWQPGLKQLILEDFETGEPVTIPLDPEKNAIQNAQAYYKRHQKLKRSRQAIAPLMRAVRDEIAYLEQIEAALKQIPCYETITDLTAISDIRDELIQQGYLEDSTYRPPTRATTPEVNVRKFFTPNQLEIWVGRNNRQNDLLISQLATDYDLWFHTQEIPGSHVLLRLQAGQAPTDEDLQFTADVAAYFSRAQQADQVPVVYTQPRYVFKPKGARPGMVTYTHEQILWGQPSTLRDHLPTSAATTDIALVS